jgi:hypothetical protein
MSVLARSFAGILKRRASIPDMELDEAAQKLFSGTYLAIQDNEILYQTCMIHYHFETPRNKHVVTWGQLLYNIDDIKGCYLDNLNDETCSFLNFGSVECYTCSLTFLYG